jgi:TPR repeat protein
MYATGDGIPQIIEKRGMYATGDGIPQDAKTAVKWYTLAAEQGHALAQFYLGAMYVDGDGVPQDDKTAVKWYTLAAEQGDARAQSNLGLMYDTGKGVPQDDKTAVKWFTLAAEQGDALSQFNLGWMYSKGEGVPRDLNTAMKWYRLAAEQGDARAQRNLEIVSEQNQKEYEDANPEITLMNSYVVYIMVTECNKISFQYISDSQIETAKSKIRSIQDYFEGKYINMDTAAVWESAVSDWDERFGGSFALFAALGVYSEELNGICRLQMLSLSTANLPGAEEQNRARDF